MATLHRIPKSQPECSLEARMLAERLGECAKDEMVSYDEMRLLTGIDVQDKRHILRTARRLVRIKHQKTFGVVTNIGMKCLSSDGIVGDVEQRRRRIHRASKEALATAACAMPSDLAQERQY